MAPPGGAVQAAAPAGGEEGGNDWKAMLQQMVRTAMMFYFINSLTKTLFNSQGPVKDGSRNPTSGASAGGELFAAGGDGSSQLQPSSYRGPVFLMWNEHDPLDLYVYMTEEEELDWDTLDPDSSLLWSEHGLTFDWEPTNNREKELNITVTPNLQHNGSAWAHVIFTRRGAPPNDPDPHTRSYRRFQLNKHKLHKRKPKNLKNLLGDDEPDTTTTSSSSQPAATTTPLPSANTTTDVSDGSVPGSEDAAVKEGEEQQAGDGPYYVSYWNPDLSLHLVHHFLPFSSTSHIPGPVLGEMDLEESTGLYWPIIYHNDFWTLQERYIPLNDTVNQVPLKLSYSPIGLFKWQIQLQMDLQFKSQQKMGYSSEGEADMLRRMFLETNPVLLVITMIVSCLHMLFDMLAFKNDISFWRKNKSMEGLSLRTMVVNTFFQAVIFLYLADHDTSWMVLFSSGVGLAIDIWKIHKAFLSSIVWVDPATGRAVTFPRLHMQAVSSYSKGKTQQYDEEATSHLMYVVVPLMVGYASYSLVYERHKSWYSWIITSLTGFVYVFGFVMMTPQLYINYKLKSVAHLPWRTMVYKSLNTFIDDLFAFIIKMPTMHRLSCFRDDIIFLIYLYQRWKYPVDKKRVNEYGQINEDNKDSEEAKELLEKEEKEGDVVTITAAPTTTTITTAPGASEGGQAGEEGEGGGDGEGGGEEGEGGGATPPPGSGEASSAPAPEGSSESSSGGDSCSGSAANSDGDSGSDSGKTSTGDAATSQVKAEVVG